MRRIIKKNTDLEEVNVNMTPFIDIIFSLLIAFMFSNQSIFGNIDIEFGIFNEEIYILQARNITTIDDANPLILDNSNIVESYPNLSLPFTIPLNLFNYKYKTFFPYDDNNYYVHAYIVDNDKTMALQHEPIRIHGRYLPIFVFVLSTIVPIIGSLIPSQIRARGVMRRRNPSVSPSTLVR